MTGTNPPLKRSFDKLCCPPQRIRQCQRFFPSRSRGALLPMPRFLCHPSALHPRTLSCGVPGASGPACPRPAVFDPSASDCHWHYALVGSPPVALVGWSGVVGGRSSSDFVSPEPRSWSDAVFPELGFACPLCPAVLGHPFYGPILPAASSALCWMVHPGTRCGRAACRGLG